MNQRDTILVLIQVCLPPHLGFLPHHFFFSVPYCYDGEHLLQAHPGFLPAKDLQAIPQTDQKKRGEPLGLETSCTKKALDEFAGQPAEGEIQGFSVGAQGCFSCGPGIRSGKCSLEKLGAAGQTSAFLYSLFSLQMLQSREETMALHHFIFA